MKEEYSNQYRRWYDKDPVLSEAVKTLEETDDQTQIRVALNLIKIIIEHNIQDNKYENVEDIMAAVEDGRIQRGHSRWYDIDTTVRTAIQMLEKCSTETKKKVALDMAQLVIEKIVQDEDVEELEQEELESKNRITTVEIDGKLIDLDLDRITNNDNE